MTTVSPRRMTYGLVAREIERVARDMRALILGRAQTGIQAFA